MATNRGAIRAPNGEPLLLRNPHAESEPLILLPAIGCRLTVRCTVHLWSHSHLLSQVREPSVQDRLALRLNREEGNSHPRVGSRMGYLPQSGDVCASARYPQSDLGPLWERAPCCHKTPEQGQVPGMSSKLLLRLHVGESNRSQERTTRSNAMGPGRNREATSAWTNFIPSPYPRQKEPSSAAALCILQNGGAGQRGLRGEVQELVAYHEPMSKRSLFVLAVVLIVIVILRNCH